MASLLVARADGTLVVKVDLAHRRVLSIGRSPRADLTLASAAVSRRHALLFRHARGWRIVDVGSRHGLQCEQGRRRSIDLDERTWCRIGGVHLWLDPSGAAPAVPALPDADEERLLLQPDSEPGPVVTILDPRDRPLRRIALRDLAAIVVGADAACDVVVTDPGVAPMHAVLYREQTRWCAVDAGAEEDGALLVDGRRGRRHRLHGGAVVSLGGHRAVISGPLPRPDELGGDDDERAVLGSMRPGEEADDAADDCAGTGVPDGGPVSAFLAE